MTCSKVSWRSSALCSPSILANSSSTSRWSTMSSAMTSSSGWCSGMSSLRGAGSGLAGSGRLQSFPQAAQGFADQAGHLHLRHAALAGDLLLRPAREEAKGEDPPVPRREALEQRPDRQHVVDLAEHRVEV